MALGPFSEPFLSCIKEWPYGKSQPLYHIHIILALRLFSSHIHGNISMRPINLCMLGWPQGHCRSLVLYESSLHGRMALWPVQPCKYNKGLRAILMVFCIALGYVLQIALGLFQTKSRAFLYYRLALRPFQTKSRASMMQKSPLKCVSQNGPRTIVDLLSMVEWPQVHSKSLVL